MPESLAPSHVPTYESDAERADLWKRCAERGDPVVAIREATRGYVVRYDLAHLDAALSPAALQNLRDRVMSVRTEEPGAAADTVSQVERVGGEAGPVSGDIFECSEQAARRLAAHVAETIFDEGNRRPARE